jgi:hypothetical protein
MKQERSNSWQHACGTRRKKSCGRLQMMSLKSAVRKYRERTSGFMARCFATALRPLALYDTVNRPVNYMHKSSILQPVPEPIIRISFNGKWVNWSICIFNTVQRSCSSNIPTVSHISILYYQQCY